MGGGEGGGMESFFLSFAFSFFLHKSEVILSLVHDVVTVDRGLGRIRNKTAATRTKRDKFGTHLHIRTRSSF